MVPCVVLCVLNVRVDDLCLSGGLQGVKSTHITTLGCSWTIKADWPTTHASACECNLA